MREHGTGKRFDLAEAHRFPTEGFPSDRRGLDAGTDGEIRYRVAHVFFISRGADAVDV
jgi:hypothetical protein